MRRCARTISSRRSRFDRRRHKHRLLRPVRRRHQRRPVPDVRPPPRGGADLLQRAPRLLGAVAPRRRRKGARRLEDVHQHPQRHPRHHQGRHRAPAGCDPVRGPADAHDAPRADVTGVHASADGRARGPGARVLRLVPRPARRLQRLRHHHRARLDAADAGHRHAARHPRTGPGSGARPHRRQPAHRGRQAHGRQGGPGRQRRHVRRLHRMAGQAPLRRPDDHAPQRRVRGRARRDAARSPAPRSSPTPQSSPAPATRPPAGSSAGSPSCSPSTPTNAARSSRTAHSSPG